MTEINTKAKQKNKVHSRKHGFISMLSMIVGIVIGSGIFFKNDSMYGETESAIITMIVWGIISLIVIFMTISFIEVASATTKREESATYGRWTSLFVSKKLGKITDYFFSLVYIPVVFLLLAFVAGEFLLDGIFTSVGKNFYSSNLNSSRDVWNRYLLLTGVSLGIMYMLLVMSSFTSKGGKVIQVTGTSLKLIPLITLIFVALIAVASGINGTDTSIVSPDKNPGFYGEGPVKITELIMIALPSVMYSFDGFTHSAVLQSEAKSKKSYRLSLTVGMAIIIILYLAASWGMFAGGIPAGEVGGPDWSVSTAISNLVPESVSMWLVPTVTFLIFISVFTGLSGFIFVGNRMLAEASEQNSITDPKGFLIRRNKAGVPKNAGLLMIGIVTIWSLYLISMDLGTMSGQISAVKKAGGDFEFGWGAGQIGMYSSTEYMNNLTTVIAFMSYTSILCGALWNRKTNKVKVDKIKGFTPSTIIAAVTMVFISGYMLIADILIPLPKGIQSGDIYSIGKFISLALILMVVFGFFIFFNWRIKKIPFIEMETKKTLYLAAYSQMLTVEEFKILASQQKKSNKKSSTNKKITTKKETGVKKPVTKKRVINKPKTNKKE